MINKNDLIKIARLYEMRPWQQEKHYIQSLILVAIGKEPVVLKGGTYLWFFNNLPRFSEDLDFTASGRLSKNLPEMVSESLEFFGVDNALKIISDNEKTLSFRVSAKGPLNTLDIDLCYVYIEINRREKIILKPVSILTKIEPYGLPIKVLSGMHLSEVAAEKIRAILTRSKARDVYDLWFLIKEGYTPQLKIVEEKLNHYEKNFSLELFTEKLKKTENIWVKELKPILFGHLPEFQGAFEFLINKVKEIS
ncbi:MAG: nucleotidyl transferase AbiEii/AbiGii toxin family protein [Caldisericota bacterium]|nr:nucleotidyl transferase AbiEii/AbiGii toxin family protein [Caldisericota bacterium]